MPWGGTTIAALPRWDMGSITLVERHRHLDRIRAYTAAARAGHGTPVCIRGAAGLGKTALLRAALTAAADSGLRAAASTCWREGSAPYEPWLDILFHLDLIEATTTWPYPPGIAGFAEVERLLARAADEHALAIGVDDLHHADEGTLLLMRYLAVRTADRPLLLLTTVRDATGTVTTGLLSETLGSFERVGLSPLTEQAVRQLCIDHGHGRMSSRAVSSLAAATGGVPLQVIVALESTAPDAVDPDLPVDLSDVITRRMDELPAYQAAIVAKAAVLGQVTDLATAARVGRVTEPEAAAAISAAQALSIARPGPVTVLDLRHDLVREAVLGWLPPRQRAEADAAAAAWYADQALSDPSQLIRAAHHAIAAAHAHPRHATRAIQLGRLAARSLAVQGAPEDGVELLEDLIVINGTTPTLSSAVLLVERAHAVLLAGRLGAAMRHFEHALATALADHDPRTVAEAAAGLGALWVNTIRSPAAQAHVLAIQRHALSDLPPGFTSLHLRLRARIAAESMFWEAGPPQALIAVIDDALRLGDPATVLEVLSVAHNPLLGPQHAALRRTMADEMIIRAGELATGVLPLMALCWQTVNLFLAGDTRAHQSLAELRAGAEVTQSLSVLYIVRAIEAMVLICRGEFAKAETMARRAYQLGVAAEDPDAFSYLTGHLVAIYWYQGRDVELLGLMEETAGEATIDRVDHSFDAAAAALAARADQPDLAAHYLHKVTEPGLSTLPRFSTWLMTLALVIEAATWLGDRHAATQAYTLLEPYADLPAMGSLAVISLGSCHQWLGRAALAFDQPSTAERHFRAAIDAEIHLGHLPAATASRALLADCLSRLPASTERSHEIDELLVRAGDTAAQLGMTEVLQQIERLTTRLRNTQSIRIRRSGGGWTIELGEERAAVRDLLGMTILSKLTAAPDTWIAAAELAYGRAHPSRTHPVLDRTSHQSLRARMSALAARVTEARGEGDTPAQEAAENELDELARFLTRDTALGHRSRGFADETERARTSVRKAIVRAIKEIAVSSPRIADHLRQHVLTGVTCCYQKTY